MGRVNGTGCDAELREAGKRIERWRRTRAKRTAMPEELWATAVGLSEERGVYRVSQALRVSYEALRSRSLLAELERVRGPNGFVELRATEAFGGTEAAVSTVEVEGADGSRMTICVPAGVGLDIAGALGAFLCGRNP